MSTNNNVKRNLTEAHGWLGVIISIVLFLIFWAGAISLFKDDIQQWAEMPHSPLDSSLEDKPLLDVIGSTLKEYPLDTKEHLAVIFPSEAYPYYWFSIDLLTEESEHEEAHDHEEENIQLKVNPKTAEVIGETKQFSWADFIYRVHYNLKLEQIGTYFIGIVTLFFLFAIISGIYIHAKKIIPQFFSYRIKKTRTQWLDLHNVIGVMSLPFTLMYAITGLMFNLAIVYQIAFVMVIYQGDQNALFADAGFAPFVAEEQTGKPLDMTLVLPLIERTEHDYGPTTVLVFHHYGDESAVLQIRGRQQEHFSQLYEVFINVKDGRIVKEYDHEHSNVFRKGREVMATLHFGNYADLNLRILYFILAIAVAGMILAGNILWINKRNKQKDISQGATNFLASLTVGACCGFILATAVGFFAERIMPLSLGNRDELTIYLFTGISLFITMSAYLFKNKQAFIGRIMYVTTAILVATLIADWLMFSEEIIQLYKSGFTAPLGVEVAMILFSIGSFFAAKRLLRQNSR